MRSQKVWSMGDENEWSMEVCIAYTCWMPVMYTRANTHATRKIYTLIFLSAAFAQTFHPLCQLTFSVASAGAVFAFSSYPGRCAKA